MSNKNLIQIEINEQLITVEPGAKLIDVADENGIDIPRFCYHKKLSTSANCRMCLVEIENAPKLMPACATFVTEGMKVATKSTKAIQAQKSVMEFLLINHPLDCPVCDQGGECDLQDLSIAHGTDFSSYSEKKRIVKDKNLGALVTTDMTRCIHCVRCVRFGDEIAGIPEMGGIGRGEHMLIGTYVEKSLSSELSGNIIDLCPVGALTSKPFRFQARSWELTNTSSIAPHDCFGSNVLLQSINNKIVRVLPDENEALNEIWLSDRDRFSYLGLNSEDRLTHPMVRNKEGKLEKTSWENAFDIAAAKFNELTIKSAVASPNSTVEELYLLQKIMSHSGDSSSSNLTTRLPHLTHANSYSSISCDISAINGMDTILLIGSNVTKDVPLMGHRVRQAQRNGAKVYALNSQEIDFAFKTEFQTPDIKSMLTLLDEIVKHSISNDLPNYSEITDLLADVKVSDDSKLIAEQLLQSDNSIIILGHESVTSTEFKHISTLAKALSELTQSDLAITDIGANSTGAKHAGFFEHGNSKTMLELLNEADMLINLGCEIGLDSGQDVSDVLSKIGFILNLSSYLTDEILEHSDLVLPIANYGETSGTLVNIEDKWQSFTGAVLPIGESRPAWKVLRVIANHLKLDGFDFNSSQDVLLECQQQNFTAKPSTELAKETIVTFASNVPKIYQTDILVRRSQPLQESQAYLKGAKQWKY